MIRVLVLEDNAERIRHFKENLLDATIIYTDDSKEAIKILESEEPFDYIFLDHDLGGQVYVKSGENTGYEVAKWLSENVDKRPKQQLYTHTLNPVGRQNILNVLGYGIYAPFVWLRKVQF